MLARIDHIAALLAYYRIQTLALGSGDDIMFVFRDTVKQHNCVILSQSRLLMDISPTAADWWAQWILRGLTRKRSDLNAKVRESIMHNSSRYSIYGKGNGFGRDTMRNFFGVVDFDYSGNTFIHSHDANGYHLSLD